MKVAAHGYRLDAGYEQRVKRAQIVHESIARNSLNTKDFYSFPHGMVECSCADSF